MQDRLLATGLVGFAISAICCFTPILTWALTGLGLVALTSYLDVVLFPAMAAFAIVTGVALWRRNRS